ncbi:MAG: TIGR01777 family protein [Chlorobi bacterium]|nr:TIGR01777 family protein [Chlorobiota bacterium]
MITPDKNRENTVAISGITGFLGGELASLFERSNQTVIPLMRRDFDRGEKHLSHKINGVNAVFHFAGEPVLKKWTLKNKKNIYDSRVNTTGMLVKAVEMAKDKPKMFFSASAVGIYDIYEVHDEFSSIYADDFLANVCKDWEREAMKLYNKYGIRLIIGRMGTVLGKKGGAWKQVMKALNLKVGNKVGDGYQTFPFIHIDDLLSIMWYLWKKSDCTGVFNIVAPQLTSNSEFSDELLRATGRSVLFNVPQWILRMKFGEGVRMFTHGQKVLPTRLMEERYHFLYPDIKSTIEALVK